uniref:Protein kinase domain-containing protein n=1 Tax=Panagrolaimus davidi TaxID=227884 RepID=A0A914PHY2_9BILA
MDGDRYSLGNANKDKYNLQCCDTDNCNNGIYTPSNNNNLTCLGTSGTEALNQVKCASNDSYCVYAAGIDDDGKYEKFQGCSADFDSNEIICTVAGKDGVASIPKSSHFPAIQKNSNYFPILRQSNISNSNFVAAKIPTQFDSNQAEEFIREINSLIFLKNHDNIITFLGWTMFGEIPVLITELADTTLLTYVQGILKHENFLKPCLQFLWQISHALEYISEKGMIHRDIACRNILIKEKTIAKLGDFGLCCFADEKTGTFKDSFPKNSL